MQQLKTWKNIGEGHYAFSVDGNEIGRIAINRGTLDRKAEVNIGKKKYYIARTGFWATRIEVLDDKNTLIGAVYPEKWYANRLIIEFKDKVYHLIFRNNPLAELAIVEGGADLLAYGIITSAGKIGVKISSSAHVYDHFLDFLLWYWFVPIAVENIGESTAVYPAEVAMI